MIRILVFHILLIFFCGCISGQKPALPKEISFHNMESLPLGSMDTFVSNEFGEPDQSATDDNEIIWVYDSPDKKVQRAALIFDLQTHKLKAKTFLPFDDESESSVDKVISKKFPMNRFQIISLPRCGRHYSPLYVLYIDTAAGLTLQVSTLKKTVSGIGWETSVDSQKSLENVKICKKHARRVKFNSANK